MRPAKPVMPRRSTTASTAGCTPPQSTIPTAVFVPDSRSERLPAPGPTFPTTCNNPGAVTEFGRGRNQSGIDGEAARGSERLGFLAHELRNLTNTALLVFEALKTGSVGIAGNTGAVLQRSLLATRGLIERSLGEVRLTQGASRSMGATYLGRDVSSRSTCRGTTPSPQ
jgi:hypothetical protein